MNDTLTSIEELKSYINYNFPQGLNLAKLEEDIRNGKKISIQDLKNYALENKTSKKEAPTIPSENNPPLSLQEISETSNNSLSFKVYKKNGKFYAIGSNGVKFNTKDIDKLNTIIAKQFIADALKHNESIDNIWAKFVAAPSSPAQKKQRMEAFARNFIREGIAVKGDVPNDPMFWKNLKRDFLSKPDNNEDKWQRLTRFVPPKYMGTTNVVPNQTTNFLNDLRNGNNPHLIPNNPVNKKEKGYNTNFASPLNNLSQPQKDSSR